MSKYISVPIAAALGLVDRRQGQPPLPGEDISHRQFRLYYLYYLRINADPPGLEVSFHPNGYSEREPAIRISLHGDWSGGTTITPWMQFYLQSTVVEKGIKVSEYKYTKWDVYIGCIITGVVSYFIIFACAATLFAHGIRIETAKDAALALSRWQRSTQPRSSPLAF